MDRSAGGVTQMDSFLNEFFPEVISGKKHARRDAYCKYDNQALTAFTSSLFIAGAMSSVVASRVTKRVGRQAVMLIGGALFLSGSVINAAAANVAMLIVGRMLLGFGVGFTLQSAPVYLTETAPARWRGAFTSAYNAFAVAGSLVATVTNYFTNRIPGWGWRVSLGLAGVPGAVVVVVVDAPRRGFLWPYRQCLAVGVGIPVFFELTGIVVVVVFTPVLFRAVEFSSEKALLGSVANSATLLSSSVMDRTGRRPLFVVGAAGMVLCEVAITWILGDHLGRHHDAVTMQQGYAVGVLVLICTCTFCSGVSWAPLRWVLPSEIYPLEVRSAGQAVSISVQLCLAFLQLQLFAAMLCHMRFAVFLFYVDWLLLMVAFVVLFLPETKGVPLEAMRSVWDRHWYWKRFAKEPKQGSSSQDSLTMANIGSGTSDEDEEKPKQKARRATPTGYCEDRKELSVKTEISSIPSFLKG
ncbi:LOW QUALITY PROTEIN: hypothetical protein U9M48_036784 [Paspalum notatum var. saurae]|uniref:Major facilitator superfamily (MFS) profile domain-containing protein n=1 Tax=Paspalum notatum var. saurae TaxID=547442 RepID=A0AAQ3X8L5_PASNO